MDIIYEDEEEVLRKRVSRYSAGVLQKKIVNKYEMDSFFLSDEDSVALFDDE